MSNKKAGSYISVCCECKTRGAIYVCDYGKGISSCTNEVCATCVNKRKDGKHYCKEHVSQVIYYKD